MDSSAILGEYLASVAAESPGCRRTLRIFDFDDTLVKTDAHVRVKHADGSLSVLTPGEFALYERRSGDVFDYSDFQLLINPRAIEWMNAVMRHVYDHHGPAGLVVLSARSTARPIEGYLSQAGITGVEVVALSDADPTKKAAWVDARIRREGLTWVEFFDDSHKNVAAVLALAPEHVGVTIVARRIVHTDVSSLCG